MKSPFSKWPPQYRTNSTLSDFNVIWYVGRLWCPELIPDIEKFLPVAIFKMAVTRWPFWKWQPVEIFQCWESIRDIIIYPHIKFWWYRTMLNFYRPFFIPYFGTEMIPDIEKFLPVAIFKMAVTIPHKFLNRLSVAGLGDFIIVRL
jgi:hypothetical protein